MRTLYVMSFPAHPPCHLTALDDRVKWRSTTRAKINFNPNISKSASSAARRWLRVAFDRGWGPASDGTGAPSPDQMIEKIVKTSRTYCENIANILRKHCENIAKILRKHCENIVKTLRKHCEHIAKTLRKHCENIAKLLRNPITH